MKLSKKTVQIVKNFSLLNEILEFRDDQRLIVKSKDKTTVARADIEEQFPNSFGIHDLNKFLSTHNLFDSPELDIQERHCTFSEEGKKFHIDYAYCDPELLPQVPKDFKKIDSTVENYDVKFSLTADDVKQIIKVASTLDTPDIVLEARKGNLFLLTVDEKQEGTTSSFLLAEGGYSDKFRLVFKVENLKLLEGSYEVLVSSKGPTRWTNSDYSVVYYLPLQSSSVYEKSATA